MSLDQANAEESKNDTLTAEQATAQVDEWIAAGLPSGKPIAVPSPNRPPGLIYVQVADRDDVDTWAEALGTATYMTDSTPVMYGIKGWVEPVALRGWRIDVWCYVSHAEPAIRIEVAS